MYSRSFGGIDSDGQLHKEENLNRTPSEYREFSGEDAPQRRDSLPSREETAVETGSGFKKNKGLFSKLGTEDLILLGVALLILMDGNPDNDLLLIALAFIFFF